MFCSLSRVTAAAGDEGTVDAICATWADGVAMLIASKAQTASRRGAPFVQAVTMNHYLWRPRFLAAT